MESEEGGPVARILRAVSRVEANEIRATVLSFLFVFLVMAAYYLLRPLRDAMASDWSREEVGVLWTLSFFVSLVAVIFYGGIISRIRFSRVVPSVYAFFALTFLGFYAVAVVGNDGELIRQSFYIWVSLFSLFNTSVFWSFASGTFTKEQSRRLFGVIAVGASLGAIAGPAITTFFADTMGAINLMPIAALMLVATLPIAARLETLKSGELGNAGLEADLTRQQELARNPFSGIGLFFSHSLLRGIGLFIFLYVLMNTIFYQELREALQPFELDQRTRIQSGIDLAVNSLAILTGMLLTGRLATRLGVATTLALVPVLLAGGWLVLAAMPLLSVTVGLQIARRAGNYAITRPAREMLFTMVDSETRYKAKPVVDIVIYRGGDVVNVWFYNFLTASWGLGMTLSGVAVIAAVLSLVWAGVGYRLGKRFDSDDNAAAARAILGKS
ncbi:MAG: MFS transporter [Gammaproteobacteria bacterium]|nr:MFS transporter [Gammaproteobacteria bacterium]MDH5344322.1 MFS transporter [Gammaproteobacteria bacterium]